MNMLILYVCAWICLHSCGFSKAKKKVCWNMRCRKPAITGKSWNMSSNTMKGIR